MTLFELARTSEGFDEQIKSEKHSVKLSGVEFLVLDLTSKLRLAPGSYYSDVNQIFLEFNRAQKIENLTKFKNFLRRNVPDDNRIYLAEKSLGVRCTLKKVNKLQVPFSKD